MAGKEAELAGLTLAESLRDKYPTLRLLANGGAGSFKAQLKRADNSKADYALILGENEINEGTINIKPLRENLAISEQQSVSQGALGDFITKHILHL